MYCSQNTDCLLWSGSDQPADKPSLNSYVQDFLVYLTNTAWGGEKPAKGGHVRDT